MVVQLLVDCIDFVDQFGLGLNVVHLHVDGLWLLDIHLVVVAENLFAFAVHLQF